MRTSFACLLTFSLFPRTIQGCNAKRGLLSMFLPIFITDYKYVSQKKMFCFCFCFVCVEHYSSWILVPTDPHFPPKYKWYKLVETRTRPGAYYDRMNVRDLFVKEELMLHSYSNAIGAFTSKLLQSNNSVKGCFRFVVCYYACKIARIIATAEVIFIVALFSNF